MSVPNFHAHILIEELFRHQIDYLCLAPGSRVTPFSHAIAYHRQIDDFVHFDERGLAFHALGYAKAKKKPAPIFITSGSSLANLFPAVVEAYQTQTPLLIFSADRPYELRCCSSNQTIDQTNFFHKYALWHQDLPLFDPDCSLDFLASTVAKALHYAKEGVVHLNCQFREPFLEEVPLSNLSQYKEWKKTTKPHTTFYSPKPSIQLSPSLNPSKKGIIITGTGTTPEEFKHIKDLSKKLNWPILPDILSAGRFDCSDTVIPYYDAIVKNCSDLQVESVLHFKDAYISKSLLLTLNKLDLSCYQIVSQKNEVLDPNHKPAHYIKTSIEDFCSRVTLTGPPIDLSWLESWQKLNQLTKEVIESFDLNEKALSEPFSIRHLLKKASREQLFYLASSMPIRDALTFGEASCDLNIHCNRGASGIDGNLATAFGLSKAYNKPVTILIGDTAFLYDLNSLAQVKELKHPPMIFVFNNFGGGIFSFLPIAKDKNIIPRYFQGKHSYQFKFISKQFDFQYSQPQSYEELNSIIKEPSNVPQIVEIQTQVDENVLLHQQIHREIQCRFSSKVGEAQTLLH